MGWVMLTQKRVLVAQVSVDAEVFPWYSNSQGDRFYDFNREPMKGLQGQPMSYGLNFSNNHVEFKFYEGCDMDKVLLLKLTWGGK